MDLIRIEKAAQEIIEAVGDTRPGLKGTPKRVARAYAEILDGYLVDIDSLFVTQDGEGQDQVVIVKDIQTYSLCEHHLLPFSLRIAIGYLPDKRVIGLSKIERLANAFSHRFQLQERITEQIADVLMKKLE